MTNSAFGLNLIKISESDLHSHIKKRMLQRGITLEEIETALNDGWEATDAKADTIGKTFIFRYNGEWEGVFNEEKEVSVYYKYVEGEIVLLTAKARYGKDFLQERGKE